MKENRLKRTLGFWDVLFFGVGGIVGAGIYAIIGQAADLSGDLLWVSFLVAAIIAMLTSLSYAEFVSRFPDAGGSFEYIKQGFGPGTALFMSFFMVFTGIVAAAAIAISFAEYLSRLIELPSLFITAGVIVLMAIFNITGSKYSSYYNAVATIITITGLSLVVLTSIPELKLSFEILSGEAGINDILAGSALIFFSYIGFEDLVKMAEETKDPRKNMPRAIILSGIIVLIIYVSIAVCSVGVLGAETLADSPGPLAAVIQTTVGSLGAMVLVIVALFATSKTILSNIMGTSRLLYDVARDSGISWLEKFTTLSGIGRTPNYAIVSISLVAICFALIGDLRIVASISNVFIFIVFGMVNSALIRFRMSVPAEKAEKPAFYIPFNIKGIPVLTILALSTLLVLFGYNLRNIFG